MSLRSILPFSRASAGLAPSDPFMAMQRDMDRLMGDVWRGFGTSLPRVVGEAATVPRLDVKETEKAILIEAELPGVDEKDVDVELSERVLTIRGEKKQEEVKEEKGYHLSERSYGSFLRSLQLPFDVDSAAVEAKFAKGVLTITVPKPKAVVESTRKIAVKAA